MCLCLRRLWAVFPGPPLAFSLVMHVNYNLVSPSDKKEEYEWIYKFVLVCRSQWAMLFSLTHREWQTKSTFRLGNGKLQLNIDIYKLHKATLELRPSIHGYFARTQSVLSFSFQVSQNRISHQSFGTIGYRTAFYRFLSNLVFRMNAPALVLIIGSIETGFKE